ncbi:MAG TPA: O-antigen ligase family protein [Thermoanaerobaculia bacterium]|nr:O-antigen ligase family protein [Thermoanaerobaculia bacterium]
MAWSHRARGAPAPPARDVAFWGFALNLWAIWALALSNVFMGVSALAVLAARWRGERTPALLVPARLLRPLTVFVLVFLASVAFSYEPLTSLVRLKDLLSFLPLLLALAVVRDEPRARLVVRGLLIMGALVAALGLAQVAIGAAGVEVARRIPGPFSHYQTFAGVLLLCAALALARLVCGPAWRMPGTLAGAAVVAAALSLNLTRGSWVALGAAALFLLAVRRPRHLLWVAPAAIVLAVLLPAAVRDRAVSILDLRDESNYDRLCMLDAGLRMVAERPLLGLGPGVVKTRYPLYRHPTAPRDRRPHLHNSYLQLAAEHGLLALAAFVGILGASFTHTLRNYRREGAAAGPRADLHLGVAAALVAYTLAAFFEDNWADTEVQKIALFVIALPFCLDSSSGDA